MGSHRASRTVPKTDFSNMPQDGSPRLPHSRGAKEASGGGLLGRVVGTDNAKALRGFVAAMKRMQNNPNNEAERRFIRHARYRGFLLMSSMLIFAYTHPEAQKHWLEVSVAYENWKTSGVIERPTELDPKAVDARVDRWSWIWGDRIAPSSP